MAVRPKHLLLVTASLLAVGLAMAQEQPSTEPMELSLAQCVELALRSNYAVRIGQVAVEEAEAGVGLARSANMPRLTTEASYLRLGPQVAFDVSIPGGPSQSIEMVPKTTWVWSFSLTQPLYTSGLNEARVQLARLGVDLSRLGYDNSRRTVALSAEEGYFSVLNAQAMRGVAEESLGAAQEHRRLAQVRVDAGAAPRFEVLRAEVEVANVMHGLIAAENAVDLTKAILRNILALDPTVGLVLQEPGESLAYDGTLAEAMAEASQNRSEVRQARMAVRLAATNVRVQKASDGVMLSLIGGYDFQKATGFGSDKSWRIGVGASKPLFDGGQTRAATRQAEAQAEQARLVAEQVEDAIELDVTQAYLAVTEAGRKLQSTQATVEQAVEGLRIAELRYENGIGTNVEVLDARVALTAARTNHVNATYEHQVALARLRSAMERVPVPAGEPGGVAQ